MCQQVYDVTKFLEDHPGGDEVLLSATGTNFSSALCQNLQFHRLIWVPCIDTIQIKSETLVVWQGRMQLMILRMLGIVLAQ